MPVRMLFMSRKIVLDKRLGLAERRSKISQARTLSGRHLLRAMDTVEDNAMYGQMTPVASAAHPDCPKDSLDGLVLISADRLRIVHRVGEGAFGTVYKAWLSADPSSASLAEAVDGGVEKMMAPGAGAGAGAGARAAGERGSGDRLVAVKTLRDSSTGKAHREFFSECKIMAALHHVNIVTFYGVVLLDEEGCRAPQLVTEFAVHGDLATALRKNDPAMRDKEETFLHISREELLSVCQQVAAGMEYLSNAHFIHRDLAARNCLLMEGLHVKISDFGMSKDIYTSEIYKVEGTRLLPVRWMSPECLRYGQFTVSSDLWAFGVLLWEVYTYGRQPYCGFSNLQVMQQICQGKLLERPEHCPDRVHKVMAAWWRMNPNERCSFSAIRRMLQPDSDLQTAVPGDPGPSPDPCHADSDGNVKKEEEEEEEKEEEDEEVEVDGSAVTWRDDSALCDDVGEWSPLNEGYEGLTSV